MLLSTSGRQNSRVTEGRHEISARRECRPRVDFGLNGTIALVTGGASGIGLACARWMADRGCRVVIADRDEAAADPAAREIFMF
jgi:NADPH:quinone reductase-like Zn-dependent oxidoreductase